MRAGVNSLGGRMYVEDDLRSGWRPLQVAPHPYPKLVDVRVLAIVRRDWQRVWDGKQLKEDSCIKWVSSSGVQVSILLIL